MADDLFGSLRVSASGMSAQRKRMEAIAENIANAGATRSESGEAYKRKAVVVSSGERGMEPHPSRTRLHLRQTSPGHLSGRAAVAAAGGERSSGSPVTAEEAVSDEDAFQLVYDPNHPDADEEGYVQTPAIDTVTEMVDMVAATRAYEANLAAMKAYRSMFEKSLEI